MQVKVIAPDRAALRSLNKIGNILEPREVRLAKPCDAQKSVDELPKAEPLPLSLFELSQPFAHTGPRFNLDSLYQAFTHLSHSN